MASSVARAVQRRVSTVRVRRWMFAPMRDMNPMCASGIAATWLGEWPLLDAASMRRMASMFRPQYVAPLGRPVVPLVYTIATARSSSSWTAGGSPDPLSTSSGDTTRLRIVSSICLTACRP